MEAENTPTSRFTIHIMKVLRQSHMCVHAVEGKYAVSYPHNEGVKFIAKKEPS
jgi:hypothetical protein